MNLNRILWPAVNAAIDEVIADAKGQLRTASAGEPSGEGSKLSPEQKTMLERVEASPPSDPKTAPTDERSAFAFDYNPDIILRITIQRLTRPYYLELAADILFLVLFAVGGIGMLWGLFSPTKEVNQWLLPCGGVTGVAGLVFLFVRKPLRELSRASFQISMIHLLMWETRTKIQGYRAQHQTPARVMDLCVQEVASLRHELETLQRKEV